AHTTTGCGKQGFPSAQPYLSHTPGANPFCCMFLSFSFVCFISIPFKSQVNVKKNSACWSLILVHLAQPLIRGYLRPETHIP
ncbi:hypothetical protein BP00DRAFT_344031, partial [Aspergillus indologenus CBS 114.80]